MKKQLLLSVGIAVSAFAFGQQGMVKVPAHLKNQAYPRTKQISDPQPSGMMNYKPVKNSVKKTSAFTETIIGHTYYDLQSNSSVGDRIWVGKDGSISAVWTMCPNAESGSQYPSRGTGYVYFNGTSWGAEPTAKIETQRTGWPNIVQTRSGGEVVLSHNTVVRNVQVTRRGTKSTGAWTESTSLIPSVTSPDGNFWPRMVASGDTLYALTITTPSTSSSSNTSYQGLNGAITFHRSKDAGVTWDIVNVVPTGLTSVDFSGFGGDSYAIACNGSTVAIVAGTESQDLVMTKSTDAGATWTSTRILQFPIAHWDPTTQISDVNNDNVADTITTNDGNFAIAVDNNGGAHVFFGLMRILQTTPQAGYSYFPYTDGLAYWNESHGANVNIDNEVITAVLDRNGNGTLDIPTPASGLGIGTFYCSMTSFPSAAVDANNVIYLSYSSVVDSLYSIPNPDKAVRQIFIMKSTDGGANWSTPCDIQPADPNLPYEGVYASMAKNVDGNVHLIYQRDLFAGQGVPPTSGTAPDPENADQQNEIVYFKIASTDVGTCSAIDQGVNENHSIVNSLNCYPNPAVNNTTIEVNLKENSKMEIVILNSVGQVVFSNQIAGNAGINKIDFNTSHLSSGIYFYQVKVGSSNPVSKKLMIQK